MQGSVSTGVGDRLGSPSGAVDFYIFWSLRFPSEPFEEYVRCQRPYCIEYTRSHPNSEVKRCKARSVLGWGTAWEVLRVLLAFVKVFMSIKTSYAMQSSEVLSICMSFHAETFLKLCHAMLYACMSIRKCLHPLYYAQPTLSCQGACPSLLKSIDPLYGAVLL